MTSVRLICCFLILFLITCLTISGQDALTPDSQEKQDTLYRITTSDGNEYLGTIVSESADIIVLSTDALGLINIKKLNIKSREIIQSSRIIEGQLWFDNPQSTRYFFSPNAYGPAGESYYQNVWVLFNQFVLGLSDNVTLGFGGLPLFFFGGASTPVWITPRVSIPIDQDNFSLGAGGLIGTVLGEDNSGFGILYGISTFGNRDNNVSFGLGYGYAGGDFADSPTISFSGMFRTGPRGYFLTENYHIGSAGDNITLISIGGRRIIKNIGLDFGGIIPVSEISDNFLIIPWLGITVPLK